MKKEDIDAIVIHCSATPAGKDIKAADIEREHKKRGFKCIGYNYVIDLDGTVEVGRPLTMDGAHCNTAGTSGKSYNKHSIGICYVGGLESTTNSKGQIVAKLDKRGNPIAADTRTDAQKLAIAKLIYDDLLPAFPNVTDILGHRDASPDTNGDGEIEPAEWIKQCPCFPVRSEFPIAVCVANRK